MRLGRLERLLSGYAAGTLSDEERRALFAAALEDQAVFDALAREQSLKELLDDPGTRRILLEALRTAEPSLRQRILWWAGRPRVWAAAGCGAAVVLAVAWLISQRRGEPPVKVVTLREAPAPSGTPRAEEMRVPERGAAPAPRRSSVRRTAKERSVAGESSGAVAQQEFGPAAASSGGPGVAPVLREEAVGERSAAANPVGQGPAPAPPPVGFVAAPAPVRTAPQAATAEALGIALYRRAPEGDDVPIGLETVLHAGDRIRVAVVAPADGILTAILEEGGARRPLFRGAVRKGERRVIPEGDPIVLGNEPGARRLLLVLGSPELSSRAGDVKVPSATDVSVPITVEVPLRYRSEP
jgi:hypothetical protein